MAGTVPEKFFPVFETAVGILFMAEDFERNYSKLTEAQLIGVCVTKLHRYYFQTLKTFDNPEVIRFSGIVRQLLETLIEVDEAKPFPFCKLIGNRADCVRVCDIYFAEIKKIDLSKLV